MFREYKLEVRVHETNVDGVSHMKETVWRGRKVPTPQDMAFAAARIVIMYPETRYNATMDDDTNRKTGEEVIAVDIDPESDLYITQRPRFLSWRGEWRMLGASSLNVPQPGRTFVPGEAPPQEY